jgi:hypothetical protein
MAKDIKVAIVCPHFEELIIRAVPLVKNFLNPVIAAIELKYDRTLIGLPA